VNRIYKVARETTGHDEADAFIIVASSANGARKLAADHCGDEGREPWLSRCDSVVAIVGHATGVYDRLKDPTIVLRSFNAG
jgi:hypothetical protein